MESVELYPKLKFHTHTMQNLAWKVLNFYLLPSPALCRTWLGKSCLKPEVLHFAGLGLESLESYPKAKFCTVGGDFGSSVWNLSQIDVKRDYL